MKVTQHAVPCPLIFVFLRTQIIDANIFAVLEGGMPNKWTFLHSLFDVAKITCDLE